jgi:hypothetical protein
MAEDYESFLCLSFRWSLTQHIALNFVTEVKNEGRSINAEGRLPVDS